MITVVNLTPHVVVVIPLDGAPVAFTPAGPVARIREVVDAPRIVETVCGDTPIIPVYYTDAVDELPEPAPGVLFLVSRVTAAAVARPDLVFPQGELRDDAGQIIGCRGLGTFLAGGESSEHA